MELTEAFLNSTQVSKIYNTIGFKENLKNALDEILGESEGKRIKLELAKDGSGVGAAIIAAVN